MALKSFHLSGYPTFFVILANLSSAFCLVLSLIQERFLILSLYASRIASTKSLYRCFAFSLKYSFTNNCPKASPIARSSVSSTLFHLGLGFDTPLKDFLYSKRLLYVAVSRYAADDITR